MSSLEDRLRSAGRETRSVFERRPVRVVDPPYHWTRRAAFAGGVAVVTLLIAVPALWWGSSDPTPIGPVGSPEGSAVETTALDLTPSSADSVATTFPPVPAWTCGGELPVTVELPDDFEGPIEGMSPQASEPLDGGQYGIHWTGREGSIEIRWPADMEYLDAAGAQMRSPANVSFILFGSASPEVFVDNPHGFPDAERATLDSGPAANDCHIAQLTVFGPSGSNDSSVDIVTGSEADSSVLRLAPELPRLGENQLVVATRSVSTVPAVVPCTGGSDEATISEDIPDPVVHATPLEALEVYVESVDRWPRVGYFEFQEPDGTITYGMPFAPDPMIAPTPDDGLVIAVSVIPVGNGWAVDTWESSGC